MLVVLLPFGVQLVHSLEYHEHFCNEKTAHIDSHELNCDEYHYKINQNSIDFLAAEVSNEIKLNHQINYTSEALFVSIQLHKKSSRAPPVLLIT